MSRAVILAAVLVAVSVACTDAPRGDLIWAEWELDSYQVAGVSEVVVVGRNTADRPRAWFKESGEAVGNLGCNDWSTGDDGYEFDGIILRPGDILRTVALCMEEGQDLMAAEEALLAVLEAETIEVAFEADDIDDAGWMEWTVPGYQLRFYRLYDF